MKMLMTRQALARQYSVDARTIVKWLKEIGVPARVALKPSDYEKFKQHVGNPVK